MIADGRGYATPGDTASAVHQPVERVIVVGAGMAGLAAANALAAAGVDVVVLEARNRIGGRLHTFDLDGSPIDLGGSWIHTPVGNPMSAWADHVGVERRPAHLFELARTWDAVDGRVVEPADFAWLREQADHPFRALVDSLLATPAADVSVARAIEEFVGRQALDVVVARRLRWALRRFAEGDSSGRAEDVSARWFGRYGTEYGGDVFGDMPAGGYRRLLEPLAGRLDLHLGSVVRRIERTADGVAVDLADGTRLGGSHVLVTVPLGVLKSDTIEFVPPLPDDRRGAIDRLGFGRFEKLALRFDERATVARVPSLIVLSEQGTPELPVVMNLTGVVGEPVLVAYAFGASVGLISAGSEAEGVGRLVDLVRRATGSRLGAPTTSVRTSWGSDPFTRGAYAFVALGSAPSDFDLLGEPIEGRLLFAGEATSQQRVGYADGAMSSGLREAARILGRPGVQLRAS